MSMEAGVLAVATTAFAWSEAQQKRLCCRAAMKNFRSGHSRVRGCPSQSSALEGAGAVRFKWCAWLYRCAFLHSIGYLKCVDEDC